MRGIVKIFYEDSPVRFFIELETTQILGQGLRGWLRGLQYVLLHVRGLVPSLAPRGPPNTASTGAAASLGVSKTE